MNILTKMIDDAIKESIVKAEKVLAFWKGNGVCKVESCPNTTMENPNILLGECMECEKVKGWEQTDMGMKAITSS